jgi:hypothetical protein
MKEFHFWRNCIVSESYVVQAETEEEARQMLHDGAVEVFSEEWIDWISDDFELEHVEEKDPLYVMVKGYKLVDSLG